MFFPFNEVCGDGFGAAYNINKLKRSMGKYFYQISNDINTSEACKHADPQTQLGNFGYH